ncbi:MULTISPECIES: hypothetical protein [Burkholderia]|uniref:hypothetical protein n=1 Tax=Burkholderia TaxID=32008 RepID=UPI001583317C|nr:MULTISPECIES: hypothetical protein [Burkholderia]
MPIENIVAAAELSATTEPVGNCMGASPRAACATPDHYPGTEGKSTTRSAGGARMPRPAPAMPPAGASTVDRIPNLSGDYARGTRRSKRGSDDSGGASPMIVVTD